MLHLLTSFVNILYNLFLLKEKHLVFYFQLYLCLGTEVPHEIPIQMQLKTTLLIPKAN